jgi:hypothetical protein
MVKGISPYKGPWWSGGCITRHTKVWVVLMRIWKEIYGEKMEEIT